jgi:hypothetical protein
LPLVELIINPVVWYHSTEVLYRPNSSPEKHLNHLTLSYFQITTSYPREILVHFSFFSTFIIETTTVEFRDTLMFFLAGYVKNWTNMCCCGESNRESFSAIFLSRHDHQWPAILVRVRLVGSFTSA